jgi:hypothetical protein
MTRNQGLKQKEGDNFYSIITLLSLSYLNFIHHFLIIKSFIMLCVFSEKCM